MQKNELTYDYKATFDTDKEEMIHLIDNTSTYYFYLSKGNNNVKIAPVGSIKTLELTNNKKLK